MIPDRVHDPLRTAERLAKVTGLAQSDADEMASQIEAWPPQRLRKCDGIWAVAAGAVLRHVTRLGCE